MKKQTDIRNMLILLVLSIITISVFRQFAPSIFPDYIKDDLDLTLGTEEDYKFFNDDSFGYYRHAMLYANVSGEKFKPQRYFNFRPFYPMYSSHFLSIKNNPSMMYIIPFISAILVIQLYYLILRKFKLSKNFSLLGAVIFLFNHVFLFSSIIAMADMLQLLYILTAYVFWENKRDFWAMITFSAAILTKEQSILFLIPCLILDIKNLKKRTYYYLPIFIIFIYSQYYYDWFNYSQTIYAESHNIKLDLYNKTGVALDCLVKATKYLICFFIFGAINKTNKPKLEAALNGGTILTILMLFVWSQPDQRLFLSVIPMSIYYFLKYLEKQYKIITDFS